MLHALVFRRARGPGGAGSRVSDSGALESCRYGTGGDVELLRKLAERKLILQSLTSSDHQSYVSMRRMGVLPLCVDA